MTWMRRARVVCLVVVAWVSGVSSPAFADGDTSDCSLSADVLRSQIDARRLSKGAKVVDSGRVGTRFHETVQFADGVQVVIEIGGCAHLGLTFDVRDDRRITATTSVASAVALLLATLPRLPARKRATLRPAEFLEALRRVPPDAAKFPVTLDCGKYVTCELSLEATPTRLRLSYDFPL